MNMRTIGTAAFAAAIAGGAFADAERVYDVDDYVQDGLILHFDGIRNVGADSAHDNSATTWANLGSLGSANDATLTVAASYPGSAEDGVWESDGYRFKMKNYFLLGGTVELGASGTVQIFTDYDYTSFNALSGKSSYPCFFGAASDNNDRFVIYGATSASSVFFKPNVATTGQNPWTAPYITVAFDSENHQVSITNGLAPAWIEKTSLAAIPELTYAIGTGKNSDSERSKRMAFGKTSSVRVYTNILTEAQMEWNRIVDESRFGGDYGGVGADVANVIVATDTDGVEGTEASGRWYVASGASHTFTASAQVVTSKGIYECAGYTIETHDGSAWGEAVSYSATSYNFEGGYKVRLTWKWTKLATVLGNYDVEDYVQDDLILHFDGIRNVGATDAHDTTTNGWANLVENQPSATFVRSDASYGSWRDTGFYFEGVTKPCGAWLDEAVSLGPNMTVQVAVTVDPAAQQSYNATKKYPAYFYGPDPDFGIYQGSYRVAEEAKTCLSVKTSKTYSNSGGNTSIGTWDGKYASAVVADSNAYLTQTASYENSATRTPGTAASQRYSWGCGVNASGANINERATIGLFHAVRVYTRALEESELAQNRAVDEARFRSAVTVVCGEIGETGQTGACSVPTGAYNMESDTWTVTAECVRVGGVLYSPKLLVETMDPDEGVWTAATARPAWAESYTIDKTALGSNRIRLTWTWEQKNGLIILFR